MNDWASLLPFVLLAFAAFFLIVRPARARRRQFLDLQGQLEPGQRVMLASGIFGELVTIGDENIELRVAADTVITVNRQAVSRVTPVEPAPGESTEL